MDFKVIISQPAIDDLKSIVSYIAPHNPDAARRVGTELLKRTRVLTLFPEIGRHAPETDHPDIREIIYRSYRIFLSGQAGATSRGSHPVLARRAGVSHHPGALIEPG